MTLLMMHVLILCFKIFLKKHSNIWHSTVFCVIFQRCHYLIIKKQLYFYNKKIIITLLPQERYLRDSSFNKGAMFYRWKVTHSSIVLLLWCLLNDYFNGECLFQETKEGLKNCMRECVTYEITAIPDQ